MWHLTPAICCTLIRGSSNQTWQAKFTNGAEEINKIVLLSITNYCQGTITIIHGPVHNLPVFNGWQLAKMKKSIPDMSLPWNLWGWSSWSKKLQKYLKNYDICENVKFGAISWKFDILSITAWLKLEFKKFFCTRVTHIIVIIWSTAHFVSTLSIFSYI